MIKFNITTDMSLLATHRLYADIVYSAYLWFTELMKLSYLRIQWKSHSALSYMLILNNIYDYSGVTFISLRTTVALKGQLKYASAIGNQVLT